MTTAILLLAALASSAPTPPARPPAKTASDRPGAARDARRVTLPERLSSAILSRLPASWKLSRRTRYAQALAQAMVREGRRRGLDPLGLAAIARIESSYLPWLSHRGDDSHGPYQLIRRDSGPREALGLLRGCRQPGASSGAPGGICEAPEVAARRTARGGWSKAELRDPVISTYVAAYEIRRHALRCSVSRHRHRRIPAACRGLPELVRWGHFNSGYNPLRWYYLKRLCSRYRLLRAEVMGARDLITR